MATDRQIAANRRNARKSTGPRSATGKQRSRRNAYRHGLSAGICFGEKEIEKLAKEVAVVDAGPEELSVARQYARAELQLCQIRRTIWTLVNWTRTFGTTKIRIDPPLLSGRDLDTWAKIFEASDRFLKPPDPEVTMPEDEGERTTEAVVRAAPELMRLIRYERRAAASRNRAVLKLHELAAARGA